MHYQGHLGFFQFGAIVSNATVIIHVCIFVQTSFLFLRWLHVVKLLVMW
jgi:hypothetical protein